MPSKTPKQARFMRAVAHGWHPDRVPTPPMKVAQDFEQADESQRPSVQHLADGGEVLPSLLESPAYLDSHPAPAPQSPPDARSALGDPAFVSYLRDRAQALSHAQADAAGRQRWADVANSFERGRAWGNKVDPDQGAIQANNAQAQLPVTQLQQQQAGNSQGIRDLDTAQQVQERGAKAARMLAEDDPNSDLSRRAKMLAIAQKLIPPGYSGPYSASMHQDMLKGATLEVARQHYDAVLKQHGDTMKLGYGRLDEETRHHKAEEAYMLQKPLAPQQVTELESLLGGVKALDDLKGARDTSGVVDKALSLIGMGDYANTKTAAAGEVAKADARGRVNPTGAAREASLLPGAMTPGGGKQIEDRRRHMLDQAEQRIKVLEAGGVRPAEVAAYRAQLDALKQPPGAAPSEAKPAGDTAALRAKYGL